MGKSENSNVPNLETGMDVAADNKHPQKVSKAAAVLDNRRGGSMPKVVASGSGNVAAQILEIAWAHDIKVREDADLAEILTAIDIESEIPVETLAAVAEILSYLYKLNSKSIPSKDNDSCS